MSRHSFPTISLRSTAGLCSETEQVMLLSDASCALQRADTEKLIALDRLHEAKDMLSQSEYGAFLVRSATLDKDRERFSEMSNGIVPVSLDNADDIQAYAKCMRHFYNDVLAATAITSALEAISLNAYQFPPISPTQSDVNDDITFPEPQIAPWNWPVNTCPTAYTAAAPLSPLGESGLIPFPVPSIPVQEPNCLGLTGLSETRPIRQRSRPALPAGHQKFNTAAVRVQPLNLTVNTNINHHFMQDKPILQWRRSISDESTPAGEGISTPTRASSAAVTPQTPNIPFRVKLGPLPLRSPALELLNTMSEDDHYEDDDDASSIRAEPFGPSRSCTMDSVTISED